MANVSVPCKKCGKTAFIPGSSAYCPHCGVAYTLSGVNPALYEEYQLWISMRNGNMVALALILPLGLFFSTVAFFGRDFFVTWNLWIMLALFLAPCALVEVLGSLRIKRLKKQKFPDFV